MSAHCHHLAWSTPLSAHHLSSSRQSDPALHAPRGRWASRATLPLTARCTERAQCAPSDTVLGRQASQGHDRRGRKADLSNGRLAPVRVASLLEAARRTVELVVGIGLAEKIDRTDESTKRPTARPGNTKATFVPLIVPQLSRRLSGWFPRVVCFRCWLRVALAGDSDWLHIRLTSQARGGWRRPLLAHGDARAVVPRLAESIAWRATRVRLGERRRFAERAAAEGRPAAGPRPREQGTPQQRNEWDTCGW